MDFMFIIKLMFGGFIFAAFMIWDYKTVGNGNIYNIIPKSISGGFKNLEEIFANY